jgi:hypothetical protein
MRDDRHRRSEEVFFDRVLFALVRPNQAQSTLVIRMTLCGSAHETHTNTVDGLLSFSRYGSAFTWGVKARGCLAK